MSGPMTFLPSDGSPDSEQWRSRVREGAQALGIAVTDRHLESFSLHAEELARWNRTVNLTAITDPAESAEKHFLDSIVPATFIPPDGTLLDIGTGAGFPGIPLKVVFPSLDLTLLDSALKRVTFLLQVLRLLGLERTIVLHRRMEQMERPPAARPFDTIICRAFTALPAFVAAALPLLSEKGQLIAMKGGGYKKELDTLKHQSFSGPAGEPAFASDRFDIRIHEYHLPFSKARRALIILKKQRPPGV
ncbi:16S rRNA (guanine(527)-N(7))-methyltransferase RsmG [Desulfosudis oleivorans]|uniref:Ribosomal RNA small subunit methyltransferase G n=1 Tax=Desulfosudis oleivorans (strain DSM 6200 / JCM 39069 / Hxd3) TaxID=96561 RepID=A8ZXP0_DESOH|nr:16S rRNA (guanine(527)-N(7))-methyltransferase RsmG [Desulfosudis oleivorans]ABW66998.1 methyltransferase GidB [Desulfosudis oleivorans Hxd3]